MANREPAGVDEQKRYYEDRWGEFQRANWYDLSRAGAILSAIASIENLPWPARICDLGCGAGWFTAILNEFGHATGVDLVDASTTSKRFPGCEFVSANILEWNPPAAAFDVVVSVEVIEHFETLELQRKYLEVACRALKPGGHLILTTPNATTLNAMEGGGRAWTDQPIENWLTSSQLNELLADRFRVHRSTSIMLGHGDSGLHRLVNSRKLLGILQAIGLRPAFEAAALAAGYGLHLFAVASKR